MNCWYSLKERKMKLKLRILKGAIGILLILFFSISCKDDNVSEPEEQYTGTLTVLQKDAYSDVAGRSSDLWPPHTTTVFKWDNGREVQLNHGTAPEETDAKGNPLLVITKVYTFSCTKIEMELLQKVYKEAVCDNNTNKFLNLAAATTSLEQSFIEGLFDYISKHTRLTCNDSVKDSVVAYFEAGKISKAIAELTNCSWEKDDWKIAFETVLGNVLSHLGHNLSDYHVCNNDAAPQVDLIKNFISTGKVEMPSKNCSGPMMFYTPE